MLIVCTGNSARSQMAEALIRHVAADRFDVFSAGTNPHPVRPEAVRVMHEMGVDISGQRSKPLEEFVGQEFEYLITVCDRAREECPAAHLRYARKSFTGPFLIRPRFPKQETLELRRSESFGTESMRA